MDPDADSAAYANDESNAEKGPHNNAKQRPLNQNNAKNGPSNKNEPPLDFRKDAHVWYLYLEDAEREASEKADQWKTGLDSLLIFAGLFGGIVSSFLLDARKDLQVDSEQNLLSDIRQTLLSGSINQASAVSTATEWVNGLWILSLYITLFSAITGVLAKAWLASYASAAKRREAEDAYNRYQLDKQTDQWCLKEAITLVPLLLQGATFLFLAGLVIRGYGDSPILSVVLVAFCASGGCLYLLMTVLPLMSPTSPFNTPLTDFLRWLKRMWTALWGWKPSEPGGNMGPDAGMNHGLAKILYEKAILSPKASHVNAAIAEIALPSFQERWIQYLFQTDTPQILLSYFAQCATSRTHDDAVQHDAFLGNCLLALLRFVKCAEERMASSSGQAHMADIMQSNAALAAHLRESFCEPGNPLHRWNSLPEAFRPLLFSLRTQVLSQLQSLDQSHVDSELDVDFGDFNANELADQPWYMAWQDIASNHRIHFTLAATRGVLHGQRNTKVVSSMALSLCLARAAHTAIDTSFVSEWVGFTNTEKARQGITKLTSRYLVNLYGAVASSWEDMVVDALTVATSDIPSASDIVAGAEPSDPHQPSSVRVLQSLISVLPLRHLPLRVRAHAVKMLEYVSFPGGELSEAIQARQSLDSPNSEVDSIMPPVNLTASTDDPLMKSVYFMIDTIASLIVSEPEGDLRDSAIKILENMITSNRTLKRRISTSLSSSVESGLKEFEPQTRMRTIGLLRTLYNLRSPESPLYECIHRVIPSMVEVAMKATSDEVGELALNMIRDLWAIVECQAEIKKTITECLDARLDNEDTDSQREVLSLFSELLRCSNSEFHDISDRDHPEWAAFLFPWSTSAQFLKDVINVSLPKIVKLAIHDEDMISRRTAEQFLKRLGQGEHLSRSLTFDGLRWLEKASLSTRWRVRQSAVLVLNIFEKQLDINTPLLKKMVELAALDDDDDVRLASIRLLSTICQGRHLNAESVDTMRTTILSARESIVHHWYDPPNCASWIPFIVYFPEAIPIMLELWEEATVHEDDATQNVEKSLISALASEELSGDPKYRACLAEAIPSDLSVALNSYGRTSDWLRVAKWARILISLAENPNFKEVVNHVLEKVANQIRYDIEANPSDDITEEDLEYLRGSKISTHLRQSLSEVDWDDRITWAKLLAMFGRYLPLEFPNTTLIIAELAIHDPDDDVQSACFEALLPLMDQVDARNLIKDNIIGASNVLLGCMDWRIRSGVVKALQKIIEQGIKEAACAAHFPSLDTGVLFQNVKLPKHLKDILSHAFVRSLRDDTKKNTRPAVVDLFGRLIGCMPGQQTKYDSLLGKDKRSLQIREPPNIRVNVVQAIDYLTGDSSDKFHDVISLSIQHLLKLGLADDSNERLRTSIRQIFLNNFVILTGQTKLHRDIFAGIPLVIPALSVGGREAVLELADKLVIPDETAASVAHTLIPVLRSTSSSWVARTTAIELLSKLHAKHRKTSPRLIEQAIPEIIALALDDKDPSLELRITAICLLSYLLASPADDTGGVYLNAAAGVQSEIKHHAMKFITLLQDERLRPSVVDLLSAASADERSPIRRKLSMSILASVLGQKTSASAGPYMILLARLISDGRFREEPTDTVMLFVASALVTKSHLAPYRFEILTALWCRYKLRNIPGTAFQQKDLLDWFAFGLFGRHTTVSEVKTWREGCEKWLGDGGSSEHPEAHTMHHTRDLTRA
ncbi:hypothetical protein EST38_g7957 [Candolleomyces aberdarensis]|uniref:DUF6535 domain-containing protein n=1 Tax=Candolleomyces aberdarensis TaxID=2316362 RepID=A0A4Q2DEE7_9AGAR|nr:hypothetical protein EST38_g7957 [Candolleomyces aberdarensis]